MTTPVGTLYVLSDALLKSTAVASPDASASNIEDTAVDDKADGAKEEEGQEDGEDAKGDAESLTETTPNVDGGKEVMQNGAGVGSRERESSSGKNPVCWSSEEITGWSWLGTVGFQR